MKVKFVILFFLSVSLSGCATYEDFHDDNTEESQHKTTPERDEKPNRQQREAIMSGKKPDWPAPRSDGVNVPIFRW